MNIYSRHICNLSFYISDASCYYRVYWMSKGASEEEIKVNQTKNYLWKGSRSIFQLFPAGSTRPKITLKLVICGKYKNLNKTVKV